MDKYLEAGDTITCASWDDLLETLHRLDREGIEAGVIGRHGMSSNILTIIKTPEKEGRRWQRVGDTRKCITT